MDLVCRIEFVEIVLIVRKNTGKKEEKDIDWTNEEHAHKPVTLKNDDRSRDQSG